MKAIIAISSVLGLAIAAPANAQVFDNGAGVPIAGDAREASDQDGSSEDDGQASDEERLSTLPQVRQDGESQSSRDPLEKGDESSLDAPESAPNGRQGGDSDGSRGPIEIHVRQSGSFASGEQSLDAYFRGLFDQGAALERRADKAQPDPVRPDDGSRQLDEMEARYEPAFADGEQSLEKAGDGQVERPIGSPTRGASDQPEAFDAGPVLVLESEHRMEGMMGRSGGQASFKSGGDSFDHAQGNVDSRDRVGGEQEGAQSAFDEGSELEGALKYGKGFAGTQGIPGISYLGEVAPGATIRIFVENSSGSQSTGLLRVGSSAMELSLRSGAEVLCSDDVALVRLHLEPGTCEVELQIPSDYEGDLYLQAGQVDQGAIGGWSFSQGLKLYM